MSQDSLLPTAPARVKALVLPLGRIKGDKFTAFCQRLNEEHVVHLRDISADGRPNRNMFSPLAFPDGAMFYDLITHVPPPSHLALYPFDLYREPLAVVAIADGGELERASFKKRQSTGLAPTLTERNMWTLHQELLDLRDAHPKALIHQVLVFDYEEPAGHPVKVPDGVKTIPPAEKCKRTTMKTVLCDISSLLLAEMTALARSFEGWTVVDSPGQVPSRPALNGSAHTADDTNPLARRNSQFALPTRSVSTSGTNDKSQSRLSMPVPFKGMRSSSSQPSGRPTTPVRSGLSGPPTTFDEMTNGGGSAPASPEQRSSTRPGTAEGVRPPDQNRISVQGFGPGGPNERLRNKGKGRVIILVGSLYLQAGRWSDALRELVDGATVAKGINDHLWHGKALELIFICLILLGWAGVETQIPSIIASSDKGKGGDEDSDPEQPKWLRNLQHVLPELFERIIGLYSRISGEQLPPLPLSESIIRFGSVLTTLHQCEGKLAKKSLDSIVFGKLPEKAWTTSPRLAITPTRTQITSMLFKAYPSSTTELLTTADRALILSGIASVLGSLGFHRKKALVVKELVSVLITGLIEARTRGAAEVGIHPAAGLVALDGVNGHNNGAGALELGEGDIEFGVDAFLASLCKTYGVVGLDGVSHASTSSGSRVDDTDDKVITRIQNQAAARHFGFANSKLNILRACIKFSEALPDFNGVLNFSSDLLRTAGSGIAPGPRREDAAPFISRDEQIRLYTNVSKTSSLSRRLGLGHLSAEYWDEFLIRGITLDPLPETKTPILHAKSVLPGANIARTSQDVNPFIYNPFLRAADKEADERILVTGEAAIFRITLQNPYDIDVDIESIKVDTDGAAFESAAESTVIGPYRTQILKISGTPRGAGNIKVRGAVVRIRGCRERRFPIFPQPWAADTEIKVKGIGLSALVKNGGLPPPGPDLKPDSISLSVIPAQPILTVKSTSLAQSAVMVLEGETQVFSITLQNLSTTTPADLLLFSFHDSTQEPLQTALLNRDATPAELYEYEVVLARKQAFRLRKIDEYERYIAPGGTGTFDFEILGKPGLTNGTVQIDYAYFGVPLSEINDQFHTRQVCLDLTVTVNASVELARLDILPMQGDVPQALWNRLNPQKQQDIADADNYCLLLMDLRNAWPSNMELHLETDTGFATEEHVLPGNTNRVIFPVPRVYIEDPHASIPALNPSRQRQFVVSTSKISPETEKTNREAFWFREKILESLSGSWKTTSGPPRKGTIELRGIRLLPRMIEAIKIEEVAVEVSVEDGQEASSSPAAPKKKKNTVFVDEFVQLRVSVANRTGQPIYPTVRLMPALCHRPLSVALDFVRKFAWNGTLQQHLPLLGAHASTEVTLGMAALCRGVFEITASVEETRLWTPASGDEGAGVGVGVMRPRSDTEMMMDAVLGAKERRIWHTRHPCVIKVVDPDEG